MQGLSSVNARVQCRITVRGPAGGGGSGWRIGAMLAAATPSETYWMLWAVGSGRREPYLQSGTPCRADVPPPPPLPLCCAQAKAPRAMRAQRMIVRAAAVSLASQ